jgi:hypothetical protein
MFGSLYMGSIAMAALLGGVQWLVGDKTLDPAKTTILRVGWAGFFAGFGCVGVAGPQLVQTDPFIPAVAAGLLLALGAALWARAQLARPRSSPAIDDLPEEHTIEVESADDP